MESGVCSGCSLKRDLLLFKPCFHAYLCAACIEKRFLKAEPVPWIYCHRCHTIVEVVVRVSKSGQ